MRDVKLIVYMTIKVTSIETLKHLSIILKQITDLSNFCQNN